MPPKKRGLEEVEEEKGGGGAAGAGPPSPALKKRCRSFDLEIRGCRHLQELASTCVQSVQIRLDAALESVVARIPEEVTKALTNFFSRVPRTLVDQNRPPRYKINFMNGLSNEVFTKKVIRSTDGEPLKICMAVNEPQGTIPRRLLSAKIKIVVLDGDFNRHNQESWESEEFRNYIVRPRDKAGAVLTGVPELSLKNGEACLPGATFIDNSKFVRSGQFRLGVMVDEQDLDETDKGGVFHVALRGRHIFSMKDLLRLYYKDEQALREILIKATDLVWTTIIEHAKKCDPGRELYSFPVEANNVTLFFNSVYQIVGATFNGDYMPFCDLDKSEKDLVGQWSKDAYKNMTYDQPDYEIENGKPRQINQGVFQGLSMQGHIERNVCQPDDQQGNSGNNSKQCKLKRLGSVRVTQNNESYFGPEKDKSFDFSFLLDSTLEAQCCASTSTNGIAGLVTLHCSAAAANGITGASLTMDHEEYDIPFTENDAAVPQLNEEKQPEQDHFASPLCSARTLAGFYSRLSSFNESDYLEMPAMGAEPSM